MVPPLIHNGVEVVIPQQAKTRASPRSSAFKVLAGAFVLLPFGYFAATYAHVPPSYRFLAAMAFCVPLCMVNARIFCAVWRWTRSSTSHRMFFTHSNADKVVSVSHVESLIVAGQGPAAAQELDVLLAAHPLDEGLRRLAVDFHLSPLGSQPIAEAILRRLRRENAVKFEHYATQRLIDVYMRDESQYAKALTELRRLAEKFPGTREAEGALECIERVKTRLPSRGRQ